MGELKYRAVTGISNTEQEGFIAASLKRIGWEVVFRATSIEALRRYLDANPDVQLLLSDDFKGIGDFLDLNPIIFRGHSHSSLGVGIDLPNSDHELVQILQDSILQRQGQPVRLPPYAGNLFAFSSIGRGIGTTTIAFNVAQEIALSGSSVLLIDGNFFHPQVAHLYSLNGLTKAIKVTEFGFSATEIASLERLHAIIADLGRFDYVIVDLGEFLISEQTLGGRRIGDIFLTWTLQSCTQLNLILPSDDLQLDQIPNKLAFARSIAPSPHIDLIVAASEAIGKRDREKIQHEVREATGLDSFIYPRDMRSLDLVKKASGTLATSAPKSLLRLELITHLAGYQRRINRLSN